MGQALKNGVSWCVIYHCEYVLRERISPTIILVQTAYNTPYSASYHGTSWTIRGKSLLLISHAYRDNQGTAVAQWLKYCATNQKGAGSIPDGVMKFYIDINPSDRTMALGSTPPLTEMSTRSISWG
jgi:hypothetical protein